MRVFFCLLVGLLGCVPQQTALPSSYVRSQAPHGGHIEPYRDHLLEIVVEENNMLRVYAYDQAWQPVDIRSLSIQQVILHFRPDGKVGVNLSGDSTRNCLMALLSPEDARHARRTPNWNVQVFGIR
jgi:hypothetical protein